MLGPLPPSLTAPSYCTPHAAAYIRAKPPTLLLPVASRRLEKYIATIVHNYLVSRGGCAKEKALGELAP